MKKLMDRGSAMPAENPKPGDDDDYETFHINACVLNLSGPLLGMALT